MTWWVLWRVPILVAILSGVWWYGVRPIAHERGWVRVEDRFAICGAGGARADGCIIDGDTVIIGFGPQRRRIRFTGFDAPELNGACPAERELAIAARTALADWLDRGTFEWNGADDPPRDRYGRELREVRRAQPGKAPEYLAPTMIARGLASEGGWGADAIDWCE